MRRNPGCWRLSLKTRTMNAKVPVAAENSASMIPRYKAYWGGT